MGGVNQPRSAHCAPRSPATHLSRDSPALARHVTSSLTTMHLLSPSPCCIGGAGRPSGRGARSQPSPLRPTGCPCSRHHQGHAHGPAALIHVPDCNPTRGIPMGPTDACGSGCTLRLARRPESHGGLPCDSSSSSSSTITARDTLLSAAAATLGMGWLAQGAAAAAAAAAGTSEQQLPSVLPLSAESATALAAQQVRLLP